MGVTIESLICKTYTIYTICQPKVQAKQTHLLNDRLKNNTHQRQTHERLPVHCDRRTLDPDQITLLRYSQHRRSFPVRDYIFFLFLKSHPIVKQ